MTETEIRVAIAEACGWEHDGSVTPTPNGQPVFREWWKSPGAFRAHNADDLPDYLHDLNAMASALETMTDMQWSRYISWLTHDDRGYGWLVRLLKCSAKQQAEAFLRTIGKWTDDPKPALPSPAAATNKP